MKKRSLSIYNYICYFTIVISVYIILPLHPLSASESIHDIQFMTENYPPNNYSENGENKGIFVDILIKISHRMKTPVGQEKIKLLPWARAYRSILKNKKQCLFGMAKSKEREPLFKWAGPVLKNNSVLISKSNRNLTINSIADLQNFKIGVVKEDITEKILLSLGVDKKNLFYSYGDDAAKEILAELNRDMIDLWADGEIHARWIIKTNSFDSSDYRIVYSLMENEGAYAFSKDISDEFVSIFQNKLDEVLSDGTAQSIVNKYVSNELNSQ